MFNKKDKRSLIKFLQYYEQLDSWRLTKKGEHTCVRDDYTHKCEGRVISLTSGDWSAYVCIGYLEDVLWVKFYSAEYYAEEARQNVEDGCDCCYE